MSKPSAQTTDIKSVARQMNLTEIDTLVAVDRLADDMLRAMYREAVVARKAKIKAVWLEWHPNAAFDLDTDTKQIASTMLMGPPGHGKTTSFKQAAFKVAKALGMRYLENGDVDDIAIKDITENDMVFVSEETAGMLSRLELGGIPSKHVDSEGHATMAVLPSSRWVKLVKAGGGVLLLDDFMNAGKSLQDAALSMTEEKRLGGFNFKSKTIGLTGNLGKAIDNTNTNSLSAAQSNRIKIFFVQDNPVNFVNRVTSDPQFRDELGDLGVSGFLQRMDTYFARMPETNSQAGFPSPRSWEKFIVDGRREVNLHGGRGHGASNALPYLRQLSSSYLGPEASDQLMIYLKSMMDLADPLARDLIKVGKLDEETLAKRFKNGFSSSEQHFAYQFALALADYATLKVIEDGASKMEEAIKRFAKGVLVLEGPSFAFALEALKDRLSRRVEEISEVTMSQDLKNRKQYDLKLDSKIKIANIIAADPSFTATHRATMLPVFSNSDKQNLQGSDMRPSRKRK
jgi:hypothetical protein